MAVQDARGWWDFIGGVVGIAGVVVTVAAVLVAFGAARSSSRSADAATASAEAARISAEGAATMAQIEKERRHDELEPVLACSVVVNGPGTTPRPGVTALLDIALTGPRDLSAVTVEIRDDRVCPPVPGEPVVWAPWQLRPEGDGASTDGRTAPSRSLRRGSRLVFALEPSPVPSGCSPEAWAQEFSHQPVRLLITCESNGHEGAWTVPVDVLPRSRDHDPDATQARLITATVESLHPYNAQLRGSGARDLTITNHSNHPVQEVTLLGFAVPESPAITVDWVYGDDHWTGDEHGDLLKPPPSTLHPGTENDYEVPVSLTYDPPRDPHAPDVPVIAFTDHNNIRWVRVGDNPPQRHIEGVPYPIAPAPPTKPTGNG
ncbi:hypothetical protein ACTG9Q_24740 [Actinokineospora sp. 24-640]